MIVPRFRALQESIAYFKQLLRRYSINSVFEMEQVKYPNQIAPPSSVKGMTKLDRDKFSISVVVPWLEVNEKHVGGCIHALKKYLLKLVRFKPLQPAFQLMEGEEVLSCVEESVTTRSLKRIFLNPELIGSFEDFKESERISLKKQGIVSELKFSKINIKYDNWRTDEIMKAILPDDESLGSYSIIGHVVHVNLRDCLLPYKRVIGQVLLDKVNGAKTIVNKTDIIDNTYRNFKMEVLCGSQSLVTRTKENGCTYDLDFSTVYWNPRLSTEHERIVKKLREGDVLYDVFSGIGPFAIPAARKKCCVLANDLNPDSYKWLNVNCRLNKVQQFIKTFNKDGKIFIEEDMRKDMVDRLTKNKSVKYSIHITMNLPALAVNFLPSFNGILSSVGTKIKVYPLVHIYCFVSGDNPEILAVEKVEKNLGCSLGENLSEAVFVRNVSPNKDMMRVSFRLSNEVLCGRKMDSNIDKVFDDSGEPLKKKICL